MHRHYNTSRSSRPVNCECHSTATLDQATRPRHNKLRMGHSHLQLLPSTVTFTFIQSHPCLFYTISSRACCRLGTGTVVTPTTASFHIMKPKRPVIICLTSATWVVAVPELSGLQFWMAQMPVRAMAVRKPNLREGLPVMRCMASAIGTRCSMHANILPSS